MSRANWGMLGRLARGCSWSGRIDDRVAEPVLCQNLAFSALRYCDLTNQAPQIRATTSVQTGSSIFPTSNTRAPSRQSPSSSVPTETTATMTPLRSSVATRLLSRTTSLTPSSLSTRRLQSSLTPSQPAAPALRQNQPDYSVGADKATSYAYFLDTAAYPPKTDFCAVLLPLSRSVSRMAPRRIFSLPL